MSHASLHLHLGQHLQLTPKLQLAIRLLLLSSQELNQELQTMLDSNIMLDSDESLCDVDMTFSDLNDDTPTTDSAMEYEASSSEADVEWQNPAYQSNTSLQDYLLWQLKASLLSKEDYLIGEAIIRAIDSNGFLQESLLEIQEDLISLDQHYSLDQIQRVLKIIQGFEPVGVAAKDVRECLSLQLDATEAPSHCLALAKYIVKQHLSLLANHHYPKLKQACKAHDQTLQQAIHLIQSLHPRPGNVLLNKDDSAYVSPDLIVYKKNHCWLAKLNPLLLPKLRLNPHYLPWLDKAHFNHDHPFLRQHWREAKWLIQCVQQRNETLSRVANCILRHQQAFMDHGPAAMKALLLKDVAHELHLHESTISRISTQKYLQTPQGTFELKHFFGSHINTAYGQRCPSSAIQAFLKEMIQHEDPLHPLSDQHLTDQFIAKGLSVARRTVTKYRECLHIPAAAKRKRIGR